MEDCKHEHFQEDCCVCWFKISKGVAVLGAPSISDMSEEDLQAKALEVAIEKLDKHLDKGTHWLEKLPKVHPWFNLGGCNAEQSS